MKLKIALLQLLPEESLEKQLEKGIAACRQAKNMGADIALFPEMWSDGYEIPQDEEKLNTLAVYADSDFITTYGHLAVELDMAIAVTFLEKHDPQPRNSVILFDRHGEQKIHYAKVHICDFGDERMLSAGEDFYVADLDTAGGNVKIGCMICYDREFPESARILMLKGAEIILVPNACPMEINRLSELRSRSYENMVAIATCNYPIGKPDCNGHSTIYDGIAYHRDEPTSRDMKILEAPEDEGVFIAEIDIDDLRNFRQSEVHGNAYRHPKKYKLLVSEEKCEPFIREDYRA